MKPRCCERESKVLSGPAVADDSFFIPWMLGVLSFMVSYDWSFVTTYVALDRGILCDGVLRHESLVITGTSVASATTTLHAADTSFLILRSAIGTKTGLVSQYLHLRLLQLCESDAHHCHSDSECIVAVLRAVVAGAETTLRMAFSGMLNSSPSCLTHSSP